VIFYIYRCEVCESFGLTSRPCGVCGGTVRETHERPSGPLTASRQRLRRFWTGMRIAASVLVVLVAISTVGAGLYLSARPAAPSCSNHAVNYPSCNSCGSQETYNSSTNLCFCTNGALNGPKCNRWCANNAINPPTAGSTHGCDLCPDNHTDIVCSPGLPPETDKTQNNYRLGYQPP
jgi:hypothetical protein